MTRRALVAVVADRRMAGIHPFHMVGDKYLRALANAAEVCPAVIPSFGKATDLIEMLDQVDGLFLPGSPSNVEPSRYDGPPPAADTWLDPERDHDVLPLIPEAVRGGVPMLAVCRGFQEMNVAFGGSLHPFVQRVPGLHNHKENPDEPIDVQYGPSHEVSFAAGGFLETLTGQCSARVNSLHSQGVDRLGKGLSIEAQAMDGLVEGITVRDAPGYTLGVQWHPEWKVEESPVSMAIFRSFGEACRTRSTQR